MADYEITAPNGAKYRVTAPEGASQDEVLQRVKAQSVSDQMKTNSGGSFIGNTLSNIPGSAVEFGKNVAQPFVHPIDTAKSISDIGLGILELAEKNGIPGTKYIPGPFLAHTLAKKAGIVDEGHEDSAKAVGQFYANRYGSVGAVKDTIEKDPVGFLADLAAVLSGGELALGRAPGVLGQAGRAAGAAGRALDPLSIAGKAAGAVLPKALGVTTGVGEDAIKTAFRTGQEGGEAGKAFRENLTGAADIREVVDDAKAAVNQLRIDRGNAYRKAMADLGANDKVLDFDKIDQAVSKVEGVQSYKGQDLSPTTLKIREAITEAVEGWKKLDPKEFHTPEGLDALKKKIGNIRDSTQFGTPERVVADSVYKGIRKTIIEEAPEYGKAMAAYEQASDLIQEIEKTLSTRPGTNIDTTLRKLQSVLRNNVNTNYGRRAELIEFLSRAGAPNLMAKLAGQALSSGTPRGFGAVAAAHEGAAGLGAYILGHPGVALGLGGTVLASSPKVVGALAHGAGIVGRLPVRTLGRSAFQAGRLNQPNNSE